MSKVSHGNPGNTSRPRELLERRTIERLKEMAVYHRVDLPKRITKPKLIELLTTDPAIEEEVETE